MSIFTEFLKNKNIIFKIRRSKVTDYAALIYVLAFYTVSCCSCVFLNVWSSIKSIFLKLKILNVAIQPKYESVMHQFSTFIFIYTNWKLLIEKNNRETGI